MLVSLINPPIVDRKFNFTYSVDIPLGLAYIASYLLSKKIKIEVIDALGEGLKKRRKYKKNFIIIGLTYEEVVRKISKNSELIAISIRYATQHNVAIELIKKIKSEIKDIPIVVGGNHATYNYKDFLDAGADYAILGESEETVYRFCQYLKGKIKYNEVGGLVSKKTKSKPNMSSNMQDIDSLPFPARELFPLENYYAEKSAFGPTNNRFTSIITSRGCPYICSYCTSAVFWERKWRPRSPKNVVDEIEECVNKHGINEFHFVDDNFTLKRKYAKEVCQEIIDRKLNIVWGATNGLRPENLDYDLLKIMRDSGCRQISLAPESGSQRILREEFNKVIDLDKILRIIRDCSKLGIKTSAYIIIGCIGETKKDKSLTRSYVKKMARRGLDEIGVFPLVPYPESPINKKYKHIKEIRNWEELCTGIVPDWYPDSKAVKKFKSSLYSNFFLTQFTYHPQKVLRLIKNFILRRQETKSDRVLKNYFRTIVREIV